MNNVCTECNADITEAEYNFSLHRFDRPLCREHQRSQYSLDNEVENIQACNDHEKSVNSNNILEKDSLFIENV